jgi:hypothetical protein
VLFIGVNMVGHDTIAAFLKCQLASVFHCLHFRGALEDDTRY